MSSFANNMVTENGEQFIPASQRPDGTWRKPRRVKEGYVPQEEVPLYESKGKQFMAKKQEPIILESGKTAHRPIPGLFIIQDEKEKKQSKKNSKTKVDDDFNKNFENIKLVMSKPSKKTKKLDENKEDEVDLAKKLKNLKKKLREIETLEEKIKAGVVPKPEPEQLAKIHRKPDLLMQICELEKQIG